MLREGEVLRETSIATLRHFRDEVNEITNGMDCGILLDDYNDLRWATSFRPTGRIGHSVKAFRAPLTSLVEVAARTSSCKPSAPGVFHVPPF